jgi:hypothetical protein
VLSDGANEEIQVSCLQLDYCCLGNCSHTRGLFVSTVLKTLHFSTSSIFISVDSAYIISCTLFLFHIGGNDDFTILDSVVALYIGDTRIESQMYSSYPGYFLFSVLQLMSLQFWKIMSIY